MSNTESNTSNVREALLSQDPALLDELNAMDPESLIRWSYENFGDRVGIVTSFQDTG